MRIAVENPAPGPLSGWVKTTSPAYKFSGVRKRGTTKAMSGKPTPGGIETVWVYTEGLKSGHKETIDLRGNWADGGDVEIITHEEGQDPLGTFGGVPEIEYNGEVIPGEFAVIGVDGPSLECEIKWLHADFAAVMFLAVTNDVWSEWEFDLTFGHVDSVGKSWVADTLILRSPRGQYAHIDHAQHYAVSRIDGTSWLLCPPGSRFARGQGLSQLSGALFYEKRVTDHPEDWAWAGSRLGGRLFAMPLDGWPQLFPSMNGDVLQMPQRQPGTLQFYIANNPARDGGLWTPMRFGPPARTANTGWQDDFGVLHCPNALINKSPASLAVYYYEALKEGRRQCRFLEADGSVLDAQTRSQSGKLNFWDGIPHWHPNQSPDQLGNPPGGFENMGGWQGPDLQHWSINMLSTCALLTASKALHRTLAHHLTVWWLTMTVDPKFATSHGGEGRQRGRPLQALGWLMQTCDFVGRGMNLGPRLLGRMVILKREMPDPSHEVQTVSFTPRRSSLDMIGEDVDLGWVPWQEALHVRGMLFLSSAVAINRRNLAGNQKNQVLAELDALIDAVGHTMVVHGYKGDTFLEVVEVLPDGKASSRSAGTGDFNRIGDSACAALAAYYRGQPGVKMTTQVVERAKQLGARGAAQAIASEALIKDFGY